MAVKSSKRTEPHWGRVEAWTEAKKQMDWFDLPHDRWIIRMMLLIALSSLPATNRTNDPSNQEQTHAAKQMNRCDHSHNRPFALLKFTANHRTAGLYVQRDELTTPRYL